MSGEQTPPPRYGTRKNPKTGAIETYALPDPVDLAKARKELADVLHGGQWFDDPLAKPQADPPTPWLYRGNAGTWGRAIESLRQEAERQRLK